MVQSPSVFKDSWKSLPVTVHDQSLLPANIPRIGNSRNVIALEDFLKNRELHQNVSLLVMGATRLGKSELAKLMCLQMALMYHPVERACFIFALTLDVLRENQGHMRPGVPVLLDDIDGNEFRLSSMRGQKVLVVSWAPY
jgi:hypothetical protein